MRTRGSRREARGSFPALWVVAVVVALLAGVWLLVAPAVPAHASSILDQPILIAQPTPGDRPEAPRISAKAAIVVDMDTGAVLYSRNADKQLEMASTTKIMTAILILESMPLDEKVTVPAAAVGAAGSSLGLRRGEEFTVEELLYAMLVPSANDAAITLAVAQAGSVKEFVEEMNERAEKMGLTNTHFSNTNGLHIANHYSSAKDLAKLAAYAMRNPTFRTVVSTKEYTLPHAGGVANRVIKTSNELLKDVDWVNGIKTGSTPWAGYCLVSSATRDGVTLISVILGARDEDTRKAESKALLVYGFERSRLTNLVDRGAVIGEVPVEDPLGRQVRLVTASPYSRRLFGDGDVTGQVKLSRKLTLPIQAGEVLGRLELSQDGADLGSVQLIAAQAMGPATLRMIIDHWVGPWSRSLALMQFIAALPTP